MRLGRTAAVVILALAARASNQASFFQASVPFDFVLGRETLPAGTYLVQMLGGNDGTGVVVVKSSDGSVLQSIITRLSAASPRERSRNSRLLFLQYQGKRYLKRFLIAGDRMTQQVVNVPEHTPSQGASLLEVRLVRLH